MFELYTEKARRTIFFARYEASQFGSPYIETEHLLLGLLREDKALTNRFLRSQASVESIRKQVEGHTIIREKVSTSVDLPLSNECKRVLAYAAEEAERMSDKHIGTEHLFLGLLREKGCFAAEVLRGQGLTLEKSREHVASVPSTEISTPARVRPALPIQIHGKAWNAEIIRHRVGVLRRTNWYWQKRPWKARDLAVQEDGKISFDVSLAADRKNFSLHQAGWKDDECAICAWELFESENQPEHGTGYTNGRDWVCTECYEKFLHGPEFFATEHREIT
jgi:hypothetical protein